MLSEYVSFQRKARRCRNNFLVKTMNEASFLEFLENKYKTYVM